MYIQVEFNVLILLLLNDVCVLYCFGLRFMVNINMMVSVLFQYKLLLMLVNGNLNDGFFIWGCDINQFIE